MDQQTGLENHEMSCALYEELVALKIRIAFAEIDEDELAEFDRDLSSVSEGYYSDAAQKRTLKLIERKLNKRLRRQFVRKTLPHTLQLISVALLVFFIGLTTAVATVRPIRLRIMDFIAQIEENYSEIGLANDIECTVVPPEWKGKYYPSYIPVSYEFSYIDEIFNIVCYTGKDDRVLQFSEYAYADYSSIDIDEKNAFSITVNESSGIAMSDGKNTSITWRIDDVYLYLRFTGNLDEAKRIAESVKLLN